jgi:hypothetical protein
MKSIEIILDIEDVRYRVYETNDRREDFETEPHPYGFYHYKDNLKESTALSRLKKVMIQDKEERIKELKKEIDLIKNLKYNGGDE